MNLKSDIIYGSSCHVLDDWMRWKIRCAAHDSMISKPAQFSHNKALWYLHFCILLGFWSDYIQISLYQKFVLFM